MTSVAALHDTVYCTAIMMCFFNDRGSRVYMCKKLFLDTFVKHVFQNFEPFLAKRALKFQKSSYMN
jgi:hypothetical protein